MVVIPYVPAKVISTLRPYWRWRWTMIACAWIVALVGWMVVATIPNRFESMTRIYVDTENLLTPLLRNITVQSDVQKQLEILQRTLLNRNNIAQVAHATNMDLVTHTDYDKERLYESLVSRITVRVEGRNLFTVSYRDTDPNTAKKVVETLLNIFVETNLGQNRTSMENARNFLENQLQDYEQKLKQAEHRLADYKTQHLDMLTATGSNFGSRLDTVHQEQMQARGKYENALVNRDHLRASLSVTPQFLEISSTPQVVINNGGGGAGAAGLPTRTRVQQLRQELTALQARFTDSHPDVVTTKKLLEAAEAQLETESRQGKANEPAARASGGNSVSNPVFEQLKLRVVQAEAELAQAQIQLTNATAEEARLRSLAETAPRIEAELSDLNREYGVIKAKYEELLARRESARISEAVETSGDKVQFRIIEAPQVPSRPSFPNRPLLVTLVLVLGLGAGGGLIFLLQQIDDTVASAADLNDDFNVRVLGTVPRVETAVRAQERRRNGRNFAIANAGLISAYLVMLMGTQFWQFHAVMAQIELPSVLQRIRDYAG